MTSARILFGRIALCWLGGSNAAVCLGQLRSLLQQPDLPCHGDIDPVWQADDLLAALREKLAGDQAEFLAALVAALNDHTQLDRLNRFPLWRDQPPFPLDEPWPKLAFEGD